MRQFLHTVLVTAGYDSVVASDGPDALATLEREGPFDVIRHGRDDAADARL
jgi:CheY-like chemotaxis protein